MTDTRSAVETDIIIPVRSLFHRGGGLVRLNRTGVTETFRVSRSRNFWSIADIVQADLGDEHHWVYI